MEGKEAKNEGMMAEELKTDFNLPTIHIAEYVLKESPEKGDKFYIEWNYGNQRGCIQIINGEWAVNHNR